jgi:hypothetical protein
VLAKPMNVRPMNVRPDGCQNQHTICTRDALPVMLLDQSSHPTPGGETT